MTALLAAGIIAAAILFHAAAWWQRSGLVLDALARFSGAILATLTADDPLPIDPALGRVLDARDLTDEQLVAEVTRRKSAQASVPQQVIRATAVMGPTTFDGQPVAGTPVSMAMGGDVAGSQRAGKCNQRQRHRRRDSARRQPRS